MSKKNLKLVVEISLIFMAIFYIFFFNKTKIVIPCVFHELTGFYCPGCGITRCLNAILHLEFYQAFRYNALVFILLPFFILYAVLSCYYKITRKENNILRKIPNYVWWCLLVITIVFGILRNLPWFDYLSPTTI